MKWLLGILAVALLAGAVVYVVGMMLPVKHTASVRASIDRPADQVFAVLDDVANSASWRSNVDSVRVLSGSGEKLRWQEMGSFGSIRFIRDVTEPPARIVSHIDGTEQGFGGSWTYRVDPVPGGSTVTITEDGAVYNPVFRFLSRLVFGYHATMETYLRDLGQHFGQAVQLERLQ
jgi:hypothetical protein